MATTQRTALVTGGSQGIGEAIARRLAADGVTVGVVASADVAKAQAVCADLPAGRGVPYACDVRNPEAVFALVARAEKDLGRIDILVNSAGVFYPTPAGATDEASYDRMMDINVKGTWACINAVAPVMKAQGKGWIINIGSVVAAMGFGGYAVYCASKAAIVMMTRALAIELAPHGMGELPLAGKHRHTDERRHPHPAGIETDAGRHGRAHAERPDILQRRGHGEHRRLHGVGCSAVAARH